MPEMLQILKCMETEVWNIECKVHSNSISVVGLLVIWPHDDVVVNTPIM